MIACILILSFPIILRNSVIYMIDLPLTAMVSLCIYTIIKSDYFKNRIFSIISGVSFGLGMLTKWTFLFFIFGPVCYLIIKAVFLNNSSKDVSGKDQYKKRSVRNIILFITVAVVTFWPYYFPVISDLIKETVGYSSGAFAHGPGTLFSFDSVKFYVSVLWTDMITPIGLILFVIGITLLCFSKSSNRSVRFPVK